MDNTRLHLAVSDQDTIQQESQRAHRDATISDRVSLGSSVDALNYLHDLGCIRYVESKVVQIKIMEVPNRFVSVVNGTLVYEILSVGPTPALDVLNSAANGPDHRGFSQDQTIGGF